MSLYVMLLSEEEVGEVLLLRSVGSVELVSMKVKPSEDLLFWW